MNEDKMNRESQSKAGHPIFILIIFIALLGFVFYVPEVYKSFNAQKAKDYGIGKGNDSKQPTTSKPDDKAAISDFLQIGSESTLKFNEITISNVSLENNLLSLEIEGPEKFDLKSANYYLEFYEKKATLLGRRMLKGSVNKNLKLRIDVSGLNITTSTYIAVSHVSDDSIRMVNLPADESGLASILCSKDNTSYTYNFKQGLLVGVIKKYTYTNPVIDDYAKELMVYEKLKNSYSDINGLTTSIADNNSTFIFTMELDYTNVKDFQIDDEYKFSKDTMGNVILFKMDAEGFSCNGSDEI